MTEKFGGLSFCNHVCGGNGGDGEKDNIENDDKKYN